MRDIIAGEFFPTDRPVVPAEMIGRADDVQEIVGNVVLAGPRRIGKTSVGDAAIAGLRARGC
jgi:hypothetical protein